MLSDCMVENPTPGRRRGRPPIMGADERRAAVLDAAIDVFAQDGIHGAAMERIARQAGVAKASCYEVFHSKDELFAAAVAEADTRLGAALETARLEASDLPRRARMRRRYGAMFDFAREYPASFRLLTLSWFHRTNDVVETHQVSRAVIIDRLAADIRRESNGSGAADLGLDRVLASVLFGVAGGALRAVVDDPLLDPRLVVDLLTDFTLGGLDRLGADFTEEA
jgi:AcrR family transcriptional regulator